MDIANLVQTVGIPFAVSLGLGYAGWCGAIWIGHQVVVPLRDRHFAFLSSLERTLDAIADTQRAMAHEMERISGVIKLDKTNKD
jgi:hypothetical protein